MDEAGEQAEAKLGGPLQIMVKNLDFFPQVHELLKGRGTVIR